MSIDNKSYLLALNRVDGIGSVTISKLLKRWPNLQEMFRFSAPELIQAGLSERLARALRSVDFSAIDRDLDWEAENKNHHIVTWDDPHYPPLLREIHAPPPVLYAKGDLSLLQQTAIAIIGTRKPSVTGSETAWRFAYDLALTDLVIVSGLALGIDAVSHSACLEAGGKTIAVMATGMDHIYPKRHVALGKNIAESGLLLTEFPLQTLPKAGHFPRRNRIISGLSVATLVVEASLRSGSLITARLALEQNRDVLTIPGSILNPQVRGCHQLLQQGATLVETVQDVLTELNVPITQSIQKSNDLIATEGESLVQCIGFEVTTVDQIVMRSGFQLDAVVCNLAQLELQGFVKAVPGGYMRCR